jgi:uncharacterized protein YqfA (UPF0365 family)
MAITKDDIGREHEAAPVRLDADQVQAFMRINQAFMKSRFANAAAKETMMDEVFEEAQARNGQDAG